MKMKMVLIYFVFIFLLNSLVFAYVDEPEKDLVLNYKNQYTAEVYSTIDRPEKTTLVIYGRDSKILPAITGISVNGKDECPEIFILFKDMVKNTENIITWSTLQFDTKSYTCGRRQMIHTELITHSIMTKPGDWPWHAAIFRKDKSTFEYKCGGTLLSRNIVLTAGHCIMENSGNKVFEKEKVKVYLGKFNLNKTEEDVQEKEIEKIIIHENYTRSNLNNDIAILKLKNDVDFNAYIQPACLWNDNLLQSLDSSNIRGTVVGWGFDENDHIASELRHAAIPLVNSLTCVLSNLLFFGQYLNEFKFCAGYRNGTSACNGDSGSGFFVFVPDDARRSVVEGSWYIRGIVSAAFARPDANICDRNSYTLFTDVSKYKEWIETHLDYSDSEIENLNLEPKSNIFATEGYRRSEDGVKF